MDNTLTGNGGYGVKVERQPQREVKGNNLSGKRQGPITPPDDKGDDQRED